MSSFTLVLTVSRSPRERRQLPARQGWHVPKDATGSPQLPQCFPLSLPSAPRQRSHSLLSSGATAEGCPPHAPTAEGCPPRGPTALPSLGAARRAEATGLGDEAPARRHGQGTQGPGAELKRVSVF